MHRFFLFLAAFLASGVEVAEMMTILLGVGMTSGWCATLLGAGAGLCVLAGIVAALGSALAAFPIDVLRAVIGVLLLLFGVQWLRKGIYRTGLYGFRLRAAADAPVRPPAMCAAIDWPAFVVAFKGVLLEGLEVVFVVVAFGAATRSLGLAVEAAGSAFLLVAAAAAYAGSALRGLPEHVIKLAVGLLLAGYGTFWAGEGLGIRWPAGDLAILAILGVYLLYSLICLAVLRRAAPFGARGAA